MRTLLPEFWMTMGIPDEFEKDPSLIMFEPVVSWEATLPVTVPVEVFWLRWVSAPPRAFASAASSMTAEANGSPDPAAGSCALEVAAPDIVRASAVFDVAAGSARGVGLVLPAVPAAVLVGARADTVLAAAAPLAES